MRRESQYLHACEWNPGLDNSHLTLGEVLNTLPGIEQSAVHWLVRLFENPASPLSFPGQISLKRHDALHVLLGRGLNNQDEAFVIGFTMGTVKDTKKWHRVFFTWVTKYLYPTPYRFTDDDKIAFELGFQQGRKHQVNDVHLIPFENKPNYKIKDLRLELGINVHDLYAAYRLEQSLIPNTFESRRLDIDYGNVDPSSISPPT